ncbi:SubName: Full=Related to IST1-Putative translation initiation factor, has a role in resistance to high concentrations of sodium {ECO:0000313/EMBL:CCA67918.1} [Serendipita indica DSM 11827]|uniref:Related to IST1-Putative translation initiation factor, has a role in resistance to high concentrations of sodium n=1 Tax=Serendipita indica (strain DSM 11827) TaxID=1109443 RepID=G4T9B9_SERID|nr:SubName: Full=Related to IST1-Putative translation initiation factor, has a role in resistance to high concentrations of sodium {ECO:0000313/EMBL:CCA67918.1} [Serendipita indica DSM 11827]CCA67918.1 related to IST1-Putative translation initiation factor, has a role in resistance to high concentrations of sodium [Serendipita indica DSM 11827]
MVLWNAAKTKVQLKIAVQRLRTLQEKKASLAKMARRDIAQLVERNKMETARIKVESIIGDDIHIELLEILELYCEILTARFGLLDNNSKEPDPGIYEAICAVIYAAPRTEVKELNVLREMLMHKFGREFSLAVMENKDECVPARVTRKLIVETPPKPLVDAYLEEIARGYGVDYTPAKSDDEAGGGLGEAERIGLERKHSDLVAPLLTDPVGATSDRVAAKLPTIPPTEGSATPNANAGSSQAESKPAPAENEYEALKRRLDALKVRK